jgi:hypothetical protein
LRDKLYLGPGSEHQRAYLRNTAKPNDREIELLRTIHADLQKCRAIALAEALQPSERQALADSHSADDKVWASAFAGHLTWGKLNEGRWAVTMRQQARLNVPAAVAEDEPSTPKKYDLNTIDYRDKVLPQFSHSAGDERGIRLIGDLPSRSSYCDRMPNTAYCSYRR